MQVIQRQDSDALHQQLDQPGAAKLLSNPQAKPSLVPRSAVAEPRGQNPLQPPGSRSRLLQFYVLASLDGLLIAWAVCEHLAGDLKARTMLAKQDHELNKHESLKPNVANCRVLIEETGDDLFPAQGKRRRCQTQLRHRRSPHLQGDNPRCAATQ